MSNNSTSRSNEFCSELQLRLKYHLYINSSCIIASIPKFASNSMCNELIQLCEYCGFVQENDAYGYTQATVDLEVDRTPEVREWLLDRHLIEAVTRCIKWSHGQTISAFDDVFVVKYNTSPGKGQVELIRHYDSGDVSFMVALSPRSAYTGGGTEFDALRQEERSVLHLEQGELLIFNAALYHSGVPILAGTRYLLVGFCYTSDEAARTTGNLDLKLLQI
mmetsp:Transcript_19155/g.27573  ORF Transcript_19155/g.27573 Transcript_19155/m.27573 type:complete len:220 (+) Transcript_19155:189-848(+)